MAKKTKNSIPPSNDIIGGILRDFLKSNNASESAWLALEALEAERDLYYELMETFRAARQKTY